MIGAGRKAWAVVASQSRVLARYLVTVDPHTPTGDHFGKVIVAFAVVLKHRLRHSDWEEEETEVWS